VNATNRNVAVLSDPDLGNNFTLASTGGVVSTAPQQPMDFVSSLASNVRTVLLNGSTDEYNGTINGSIEQFVGEQTNERLPTISFSTDF
jgi:hypothetical protein